jgi:hypothetical protein
VVLNIDADVSEEQAVFFYRTEITRLGSGGFIYIRFEERTLRER